MVKNEPVDLELYEQVKNDADVVYGKKTSAYKSGYIVKTYKGLGGTYSGKKPKGDKNLPAFEEKEIEGTGLIVGDIKRFLSKSYEKKPSDMNNYKVDKKLSGQRVQVYHNPENDKTIVVHRGTASIQDWGTNIAMTFGIKGKRYKHAKKIQDQAEEKYGKKNIITMGHSQGGRWAELLGRDTAEVITLNKPTLPADILTFDKVPKNQTDIKTTGDPVSIYRKYQRGNDAVKILSGIINNPITEHKVNVLDRLPEDKYLGVKNEIIEMPENEIIEMPEKTGEGLYKILPYTKKQAKKLGVKIEPSKRKGKKIDIYDFNKQYIMSIGGKGYKDYPTYWKTEGKDVADNRRRLYKIRHEKNRHKLGSAGYYADQLLW
tara:strand:- start:284 stop:1405 length:1122 start_codon:yes stop_codon:yes gene_type:complete